MWFTSTPLTPNCNVRKAHRMQQTRFIPHLGYSKCLRHSVFMPMGAFWASVEKRAICKPSHSEVFHISEMLEHYILKLLSSVTFYRSTSGAISIRPWPILMTWSSTIIYDTKFRNTLYIVSGAWHLQLHFTWNNFMTSAMHWVEKHGMV